jgi:SEC-C motif-containing protein
MPTPDSLSPCPCGSGQLYGQCCGPYLSRQAAAPTAEALMRSRYVAFELRDAEYLRDTWDPAKRSKNLDFEQDTRAWSGLEILATIGGTETDPRGVVEFKAKYELGDDTYLLHEISRFHRIGGQWVYLDGTIPYHGKIAHRGETLRNAPCPCGSGKKYKKCCG